MCVESPGSPAIIFRADGPSPHPCRSLRLSWRGKPHVGAPGVRSHAVSLLVPRAQGSAHAAGEQSGRTGNSVGHLAVRGGRGVWGGGCVGGGAHSTESW